jgi:hypothetical protein
MADYKGSSKYHGPSRDGITEATGDGNDTTVDEDSQYVFADTTSSVLTVTLPSAAERDGHAVTVVDAGGNAGTNNITISSGSGANVDGSDQDLTISTNYGELTLVYSGDETGWFTA